jgi:putative membrane protein
LLALSLLAGCSDSDIDGTAVETTRSTTTTSQVAPPAANTTTTYAQQWEEEPVETTVNVDSNDDTAAKVTEPTPATGFAHDAYQGSLKEVGLAELALRQSQSPRVHSFAQTLMRDHGQMARQLEAVAADLDLSLQSESAMLNEAEDDLASLSGPAFDQRFAELMVEDHEKDVALFERESRDGLQAPLSEFAQDQLPKLKHHLEMARELRDAMSSNW